MEAAETFRGGRQAAGLFPAAMVCLALAAGAGGVALWTNSDYPLVSAVGLGFGIVCAALGGVLGGVWGLHRRGASLTWWHLSWLFVFLSGLVFRVRAAENIVDAPFDLWATYRVALMMVVAFVLFVQLSMRQTSWVGALFRGLIGGLTVYALVSVASTAWSVYPAWTLYKSLEYLVDVSLIAAIVTSIRTIQAFKTLFDWTWILFGTLLVAVYVGVVVRPDLGVIPGIGLTGIQIQGVMPAVSTDGVGGLGELLGIVAATRLLLLTRHRLLYTLTLVAAIATMILAQSRGALSGFLIASLVVLLAAGRKRLVIACLVLLPAVIWLSGIAPVLEEFFRRGQDPELIRSLSGRVNWWAAGWELIKVHPVIGYGAFAGPRFAVLATIGATTVSTIHNTWLEVLVGTGVLGVVPVLAVLVWMWVVLLRPDRPGATSPVSQHLRVEALGILVTLCVGSIFSTEFVVHPPLIFLLILGYAEFRRRLAQGTNS